MDLSICVALSASWRADFSGNGCPRRLVPDFCDSASARLAIAGAPDNTITRVKLFTAVQHLTKAFFLSKPVEPPLGPNNEQRATSNEHRCSRQWWDADGWWHDEKSAQAVIMEYIKLAYYLVKY